MMAAMMPMRPAATEAKLTMPPRFLAERERRTPMMPRMMAAMARSRPKVAPWKKLAMAATIARMEGMLNLALLESLMMIGAFFCYLEGRLSCFVVK
jgi:hypothetical protein